MERMTVGSGSPYEPVIGFSRAVRAGHHVAVAGTAPIMPDGGDPPADARGQAKRCLEIIATALEQVGSSIHDVVRTRCYLVSAEDWKDVGRAHGDVFGEASSDVRPASTMVVVTGFLDPRWRIEMEADAIVDDG
jgi:enamine deaminase RidA (YjgF/YER057c/UK114 family)